jgi:hypothetical protein
MQIDWSVFAAFAAPIIALLAGAALSRLLERRPKLIAYFTHATAFTIRGQNMVQLHTHGIVIRNAGKKPATDIRVRHNYLPVDYNVFPDVEYHVQNLPGGGAELVFPTLVPNEQVSISYLYFPPVVYSQIHAGIRHSDGFATEVTALPTQLYSAWIIRSLWVLLALGGAVALYIGFEIVRFGIRVFGHLTTVTV